MGIESPFSFRALAHAPAVDEAAGRLTGGCIPSCPGCEQESTIGAVAAVLQEIAVDVVLADDLDEGGQIVALWGVVRRHTQIAKAALDAL